MKKKYLLYIIISPIFVFSTIFFLGQSCKTVRETIFDRRIHIEKHLILDIPQIPRWCKRLDIKKQYIDIGDCKLYVEEEGQGIPIVLIHGGPGNTHHYFHPFFSHAKKFSRIIYYDQRGCGRSDYKKGKGYSVEQAIDDLENLRKALQIDQWVVLGHSYGGFLASYNSTKYSENLLGLVLVASGEIGGSSRDYDYVSDEEKKKLEEVDRKLKKMFNEKKITREQFDQIVDYNKNINGGWKRQHYYKPTREKMVQMALYGKRDDNFSSIMNSSKNKVDLKGAFKKCPIPTLILEGKWDLKSDINKPERLQKSHPGSKLVIFENSGHSPFEDEPKKFFKVLRDFVRNLPKISTTSLSEWKKYLAEWKKKKEEAPVPILRTLGWGCRSNELIVKSYSRKWLELLKTNRDLLKTGFALYDLKKYDEALLVFRRMHEIAKNQGDKEDMALSLLWHGHMLDLMGKRKAAISIYKHVVDLNVTITQTHSQFGMKYFISDYAKERIKQPFKRIENRSID